MQKFEQEPLWDDEDVPIIISDRNYLAASALNGEINHNPQAKFAPKPGSGPHQLKLMFDQASTLDGNKHRHTAESEMWGQERGAGGDQQYEMGVTSEITYVNDPPERDIGPNTSRNVIIRDLRQMANDYGSTNIGLEMSKMKKLENIYSMTGNSTLQDLGSFKEQVKEKKMMLDELVITNAKLKTQQKKKGPLAITDGSGTDILEGVNDHNIDQKLKHMEKRIVEAKRAAELRDSEFGIQEALSNYHEVFKQSMESMENIAKSRSNRTLPKMSSFRQFIDDTEKKLTPDGKGDEHVTKALKELKHLNKYNTFDPKKLPFIPELPYNYEEELAHLNIMYNDVLEDLNVKEDVVELPLTQFLEHTPKLKPAKSIMKKIEDVERKKGANVKSKKPPSKVKFQRERKDRI